MAYQNKRMRFSSEEESTSEVESEVELARYAGPAPVPVIATVDTRIDGSNIGSVLLAKMGYRGGGLGLTGRGRAEPVPFIFKDETLGLGKGELESHVLENTTLTQRRMASVLMLNETEEQRQKRESKVAEKERIQAELTETLKTYLCVECEKQYKNIRLYNEHLQSYDHHHRKRFKAMQAEQRANAAASGDLEKRRDKERKREAKELARMGVDSGFAEASTSAALPEVETSAPAEAKEPSTSTSIGAGGFKKLGGGPSAPKADAAPAKTPARAAPIFKSSGFMTLETGSTLMPAAAPSQTPMMGAAKPADGLKLAFGGAKGAGKPLLSTSAKKASAFGSDDDAEEEAVAQAGSTKCSKGLGKAPGLGGIKISLAPKR